jgi:hypothetical protein
MEKKWKKEELALIVNKFEIEAPNGPVTEEDLVNVLADRIAEMIDRNIDMLLSLLYRLDIEEEKINKALTLNQVIPTNVGLAHLIIERQKERNRSKENYKVEKIDGWDDF